MSAIPLFDYVFIADDTAHRDRNCATEAALDQVAASLVQTTLHHFAQARALDVSLGRNGEEFSERLAVFVRLMYEDCLKDARQVIERVEKVERLGHRVRGADELRDEIGRVTAMLSVSLADIANAKRQLSRERPRQPRSCAMSYSVGFTDSAKSSWLRLPFELQEAVLDELDRVADDPQLLRKSSTSPNPVFDFTRNFEAERHYIFLVIDRDDAKRHVEVLTLGHFAKSPPAESEG